MFNFAEKKQKQNQNQKQKHPGHKELKQKEYFSKFLSYCCSYQAHQLFTSSTFVSLLSIQISTFISLLSILTK